MNKHRRRFRWVAQKFSLLGAVFFLFAVVALQAMPHLVFKYDDPVRLKASIHVTTTNGFTIRWVEKPATVNRRLDLVFIHGSPGGAGVWAAQFRDPFPEARLFAYDRPGYGGSKPARASPHLQDQVDALMTLLSYAMTNRVLLVAHSYGSPIALLAALEHPERIGGVLLIGGDVDPAEEKPWLVEYIFDWRATSWLLPRSLRQCNREMLTVRADLDEVQKLLPKLAVPVVMLHGGRDPLVPIDNVTWLEQQLAGLGKSGLFAKIVIPEANHFIPWERPGEVERAIRLLAGMVSGQNLLPAVGR